MSLWWWPGQGPKGESPVMQEGRGQGTCVFQGLIPITFANIPLAKASHGGTSGSDWMNTKLWVKGCSYREALNWGLGFPGVISLSFSILAVFVSEVLQFVNTSTDRVEKNPNSTLLLIFKVWWGSSFSLKAKIKILLYLHICLSPLLFLLTYALQILV